jgi:hypothetical protein
VGEEGVDDGGMVGDCCMDERGLWQVGDGVWLVCVFTVHVWSVGGMGVVAGVE